MLKSKAKSRHRRGRPQNSSRRNNLAKYNKDRIKSLSSVSKYSFLSPTNQTLFSSMNSNFSSANSTCSSRDNKGKWRTFQVAVSPQSSNNNKKRKYGNMTKHIHNLSTVTGQLFSDNQRNKSIGNCMIPIQQLTDGIENNLTCVKIISSDSTLATKELYEETVNEIFPKDNKKKSKLYSKF